MGFPLAFRRSFLFVPAIVAVLAFAVAPQFAHAVPSTYDPREAGLVSGERDQAPWGMCWDFAGVMALG